METKSSYNGRFLHVLTKRPISINNLIFPDVLIIVFSLLLAWIGQCLCLLCLENSTFVKFMLFVKYLYPKP